MIKSTDRQGTNIPPPPKSSATPSRRRDKESSKTRLFEAAIETFSQLGFDRATTKVIAQRAGLNEALICRYFENKTGLLTAVIERFIDQLAEQVLDYPAGSSLEEELTRYARHRFQYEVSHRNLFRITVSQCALDSKLCRKVRKIIPLQQEIGLKKRILALKQAKKVRADADADQIARTVGFQVFSSAFLAYMVFGLKKEAILNSLEDFCRIYARGLK